MYGCGASVEMTENDPRVCLSMESNRYEFLEENSGFRDSMGVRLQAGAQEMRLEDASLWGATCMDFFMKS